MTRAIVSVATDSWVLGQARLLRKLREAGENSVYWSNRLPDGCPPHRTHGNLAAPLAQTVPYAFKAFALHQAAQEYDTLIWADSCIVPVKPLDDLWEKIEEDGVWFSNNGYTNYEWTADSAYPDLFSQYYTATAARIYPGEPCGIEAARAVNRMIPHVVATAFGVSTKHWVGQAFLQEYFHMASKTKAFCGPWQNSNSPRVLGRNTDRYDAPCGPPDVLGHRHDQTAASVIAWRLGVKLTNSPEWFAYEGGQTDATVLVADGGMKIK